MGKQNQTGKKQAHYRKEKTLSGFGEEASEAQLSPHCRNKGEEKSNPDQVAAFFLSLKKRL